MKKITIPIRGMHCKSCEILIEGNLKKISGVHNVDANYKTGKADIFYNSLPPKESVQEAIKNAGYDIGAKENLGWISKDMDDYYNLFTGAIILTVLYVLARQFGLFTIGVNTQSPGLMVALVVGLVAGISTCMALVGGLVLGLSARHAELHPEISAMEKFRPHLYFNLGRIVGFGILGGIIGYLGSMFKLSIGTLGIMTIMVGGVMIFLGLKLMEIFPRLKNTTIALPKNISKFFGLHKEQKEYSHTNSFITGALTFFLPCGFTQAMQLYAVSSGSFIQGAAIMSLFALGTAPGLLGIGGLASVFKGKQAKIFFSAAGMAVILFGSFNIANGSQLAFQKQVAVNNVQAEIDGIQEIRMTQGDRGYSPNTFTVQKGKKIRWIITSTNPYNCASSLVVPKYGISKYLEKGENIIEFVPTETGEIPFSCSMGMYRGKIKVIDGAVNAADNIQGSAPPSQVVARGAGCGGSGGGCGGCGGGVQKNIDSNVTAPINNNNEQLILASYTLSQDIVPNRFQVKKGIPVKFEINVKENGQGCMSTVMVPGLYNSAQYLQGGKKMVLAFTPDKAGEYEITCAMGVPRGVITVTN